MTRYITATRLSIENFNKAYEDETNICSKGRDFVIVGEDGNEYKLKKKSLRYRLFNENTTCVDCGLVGTHYLIQQNIDTDEYNINNRHHANLYGTNELGEEILMTKDHIIRKQDGGKDNIENLQTMCWICNCVIKN